jgi:hypothetical protein
MSPSATTKFTAVTTTSTTLCYTEMNQIQQVLEPIQHIPLQPLGLTLIIDDEMIDNFMMYYLFNRLKANKI